MPGSAAGPGRVRAGACGSARVRTGPVGPPGSVNPGESGWKMWKKWKRTRKTWLLSTQMRSWNRSRRHKLQTAEEYKETLTAELKHVVVLQKSSDKLMQRCNAQIWRLQVHIGKSRLFCQREEHLTSLSQGPKRRSQIAGQVLCWRKDTQQHNVDYANMTNIASKGMPCTELRRTVHTVLENLDPLSLEQGCLVL